MKKEQALFAKIVESAQSNKTLALRTQQSLLWYQTKMKDVFGNKTVLSPNVFEKNDYPNFPLPGNIVTFTYDPKFQHKLPYYDQFPLVLVLKLVPNGFVGLNFHYLFPSDRARFMDRLYRYQKIVGKGKQSPEIKINITYSALKQKKTLFYYRASIKRYRISQLRGFFHTLMPNEWDMALFLPTEKFMGKSKQNVWKESRKINGQNR